MTVDRLAFEEVQPIDNGSVVGIPFHDVRMPRGKVSCQEAEGGIVIFQPNTDGTLIARHPSQSGLEPTSFYATSFFGTRSIPCAR